MSVLARVLAVCAVVLAGNCVVLSALAAPGQEELRNAVVFALQCNATIGTIEEVTLTSVGEERGGTIVVRGTYRQKIGRLNMLRVESLDTAGGVFEGEYSSQAGKFTKMQFKISIRAGTIAPECLR